jgi:uncharacterized protein YdaU (DUF1376 family)
LRNSANEKEKTMPFQKKIKKFNLIFVGMSAAMLCFVAGCDSFTKKPLDAKSREQIDSISNAQCRQIRMDLDSFYSQNHAVLLQKTMDSLKIERRKEIDAQIKSARSGQ